MTPRPLLVAGAWRTTNDTTAIRDPYRDDVVDTIALAGESDAEDAVVAAVGAATAMRELSRAQRSAMLARVAAGLATARTTLVELIAREAGKPVKFADAEVARAITTFTLAAEEVKRFAGDVLPVDIEARTEGYIGMSDRVPVGPVLAIAPFNFPLNLVAHKVAPALAVGCPIILKPAPQAPLTALRLGEILCEAGVPAGAISILPCAPTLAERLVADDRIAMLSFTGSARVGWMLKGKAGRKHVLLELGGNAGAIVHPDADLDWAAERCAIGAFAYAGQVCIKTQRVFVDATVADAFRDRFLAAVAALRLGDPLDPHTDVGPVIDDAAADRITRWIDDARGAGATVLAGGTRTGRMIAPTVLTNTRSGMLVRREEVFGPVVTLESTPSFDAAVAAVNDSPYGLQAGVFTRDLGMAFRAFRHLEVGGVVVNDHPMLRVDNAPYGGVKESGFGREGVRSAMEAMTTVRTLVMRPG